MSVDRTPARGSGHLTRREEAELRRAFAVALRSFCRAHGFESARDLGSKAHLSHETVAAAFRGAKPPTAMVLEAILAACGATPDERAQWTRERDRVDSLIPGSERTGPDQDPCLTDADVASSAPVVDHADPDDTGCFRDAVTMGQRRIRRRGTRNNLGWVEVRYCAFHDGAWGRFQGFSALSALAHRSNVDIYVAVHRVADGMSEGFRYPYVHDYHWSGLLLLDGSEVYAEAQIFQDGQLVGKAQTSRLRGASVALTDMSAGNVVAAEFAEVEALRGENRRLAAEVASLRRQLAATGDASARVAQLEANVEELTKALREAEAGRTR